MSEMIERVALAISGSDDPANILTIHRVRALLAIEALRVPTDAVRKAVARAICEQVDDEDPEQLVDEVPDDPKNPLKNWHFREHAARLVIAAMIDEALK